MKIHFNFTKWVWPLEFRFVPFYVNVYLIKLEHKLSVYFEKITENDGILYRKECRRWGTQVWIAISIHLWAF